MKTKVLSLVALFMMGAFTVFAGNKTEKIKVNGECGMCETRIEKAVKAVWYFLEAEPWGHSIGKMIGDLEQIDLNAANTIGHLKNDGVLLDRFYIPTRYPNGLPDMVPDEAYMQGDAESCIDIASKILKAVKDFLG